MLETVFVNKSRLSAFFLCTIGKDNKELGPKQRRQSKIPEETEPVNERNHEDFDNDEKEWNRNETGNNDREGNRDEADNKDKEQNCDETDNNNTERNGEGNEQVSKDRELALKLQKDWGRSYTPPKYSLRKRSNKNK